MTALLGSPARGYNEPVIPPAGVILFGLILMGCGAAMIYLGLSQVATINSNGGECIAILCAIFGVTLGLFMSYWLVVIGGIIFLLLGSLPLVVSAIAIVKIIFYGR